MSEMDNTYAERFPGEAGRDSSKTYATAIDDSTAAATVTALSTDTIATTEFLDVMADKLEGDTDYLDAVSAANLAALVGDTAYLGLIADELEGDAAFLGAVAEAVQGELVSTFYTAVTGEIAHIGPADAVTLTVSDTALDVLGDNGIVPGSVTFTITANDDSETLAVTDSDNGDGTGNLSGAGVGINVLDDGASTITYATGAWTITADEALKENEDVLVDYSYSRDALVGDVGLTDGALAAIADELEGDTAFLTAIAEAIATDSTFLAAMGKVGYLDDVAFTVAVEVGDMVSLTMQLVDEDDSNFEQSTMVSIWICDSATGVDPTANGTISDVSAGASGGVLEQISADISYQCVTSATGELIIEITDPTAELTHYVGVMLPNGKYVVSPVLTWTEV